MVFDRTPKHPEATELDVKLKLKKHQSKIARKLQKLNDTSEKAILKEQLKHDRELAVLKAKEDKKTREIVQRIRA